MDFGFFGIGAWELLVIGLLALIILGPKQMILLARKAGELLRQFQQIWQEASKTIDREIRVIESETGGIATIGKDIQSLAKEVKSAMTVDLAGKGDTPKPQPPNEGAPRPAPTTPPAAPARAPAWTSSPPPLPATTEPASPSSNQSTGQPGDRSDTQSPSRPAAQPQTRYPAWTSKPDK